jgi:hypothetical protein
VIASTKLDDEPREQQMNIFAGGSLRNLTEYASHCPTFITHLGEQIVERGHTLLTGCRGSLDRAIAEAAYKRLRAKKLDIRRQLVGYRLKDDLPEYRLGRLQVSRLSDWELTHPDLNPPEQIAEAAVTVFVAGSEGTFAAANWARIADKPILGVALFGGSGAKIFERERARFKQRYSHFLDLEDFDILSQDTQDMGQLAIDVVTLCERMIAPKVAFTIMSFTEEFRDVYASYEAVCKEYGFTAERTDQAESGERIIPRIIEGIRRSAFVIADVTKTSPNVYYELGFAAGLGRPVIVTAEKGTSLPFDIVDIPVLFWAGQEDLKEKLRKRLRGVPSVLRKRVAERH